MDVDILIIVKYGAAAMFSLSATYEITKGILQTIGNKIIETQFFRSIEKYKFEKNLEFDLIKRIRDKEFEILALAYSKLCEAHRFIQDYAYYGDWNQKYGIEVENKSEKEMVDFLKKFEFSEEQKAVIINSGNRAKLIEDYRVYNLMAKAHRSLWGFRMFLDENCIFLSEEVVQQLKKIDQMLGERYGNMGVNYNKSTEIECNIKDLLDQIKIVEEMIRKDLRASKIGTGLGKCLENRRKCFWKFW